MSEPPLSWDELWMFMSRMVGMRSKCDLAQYGAVIVSEDNRVLSVGYNGYPAANNCAGTCTSWCPRAMARVADEPVDPDYMDCHSIHAEANAIMRAPSLFNEHAPKMYVNGVTCLRCALLVSNSGIHTITMLVTPYEEKRDPNGTAELLERYGVHVEMTYDT